MKTEFSKDQLADPDMADSESVIRKCVHCGFCTATCPTYLLLGDELDSPRGRIYLIKDMLENNRTPSPNVVKHVDRCLTCLSCMTTCPSGVNYMHLVDHARSYIEATYRRPLWDRFVRQLLTMIIPYPRRFRAALSLARIARPMRHVFQRVSPLRPFAAMLNMAPSRTVSSGNRSVASSNGHRGRVIILQGCAEPVLRPSYAQATVRLLTRIGYTPVFVQGEKCCGALVHHMGKDQKSRDSARHNIDHWMKELEQGDVAAIITTASGCGTLLKDYGHLLRDDPDYAGKAAHVSSLCMDVCELLKPVDLESAGSKDLTVAYHPPCSLQHGQKIIDAPQALLESAGFQIVQPAEAHICCGSAGVYNILQPEIADQLGRRKAENIKSLSADIVATSNIGCSVQIANRLDTPVVHLVELLDWATGGPEPSALKQPR